MAMVEGDGNGNGTLRLEDCRGTTRRGFKGTPFLGLGMGMEMGMGRCITFFFGVWYDMGNVVEWSAGIQVCGMELGDGIGGIFN